MQFTHLFLGILAKIVSMVINQSLVSKYYGQKVHFHEHCVKNVRIQSFPGPYFPEFGLNTVFPLTGAGRQVNAAL